MSNFKDYASYYDLLYTSKEYTAEATYIDSLIKNHSSAASSILNLGCGTGAHDLLLGKMGYKITGVDISEEMIKIANDKYTHTENMDVEFIVGDIRNIDLNKKFDVVISLFHVLSYQVENADIQAAFNTAKKHLKPGGLFIYDCWYGPGVLSDLPSVRHKVLENEKFKVHRISTPQMHTHDNYVTVKFTILIHDKIEEQHYEIEEIHKMRYFFLPEMDLLLAQSGFKMDKQKLHEASVFADTEWYKLIVAKADI